MYKKKLIQRIKIENYLNQVNYKGIPLGSLSSHTINSMFISKSNFTCKKILLDWLWILSRVSCNIFQKNNYNKNVFLLSNNTERGNSQFNDLKEIMKDDPSTFVTINKLYGYAKIISYIKWFIYIVTNINAYLKIINSCDKTYNCYNNKQKITLIHVFLLQTLKFEISNDILKNTKITNIIVDLDRGYLQAPIILAGNKLNINTITFIHGIIFPPYLYLPVIAKKVFCWGNFQKNIFKIYNNENTEYYITGNPAFKVKETNEILKLNTLKEKHVKNTEKKIMTFISQNFSDSSQLGVIKTFCEALSKVNNDWIGAVKPHPADDLAKIKSILIDFPKIVLLDKEVTVPETIDFSNLFMVVSSNFAFDSILANKPVVFWHLDDEKSGIANVFKEHAEATILNNENELSAFLKKCIDEGIQKSTNFTGLKDFANDYCEYIGVKSAIEIKKNLLSFEN